MGHCHYKPWNGALSVTLRARPEEFHPQDESTGLQTYVGTHGRDSHSSGTVENWKSQDSASKVEACDLYTELKYHLSKMERYNGDSTELPCLASAIEKVVWEELNPPFPSSLHCAPFLKVISHQVNKRSLQECNMSKSTSKNGARWSKSGGEEGWDIEA